MFEVRPETGRFFRNHAEHGRAPGTAEKNGFDHYWYSHDIFMRSSFVSGNLFGLKPILI